MNSPKTILFIEDEGDFQQLVKIILGMSGYKIETADNGIEGLAKLKTIKPDLIILDMNMPKMGGLEFYQRICNGNKYPPYPILMLTARANAEVLCENMNIDGFMTKPFEIDDLLKEIETIIQKRSPAPAN
jgi:DNA-binding response OmpR family regulator